MNPQVLVLNSGSSSIKYQLVDLTSATALASGLLERIGSPTAQLTHNTATATWQTSVAAADHQTGMSLLLEQLQAHGPALDASQLVAVGHRVVQGGSVFQGPVVVDATVKEQIAALIPLAPLHNPANLAGILGAEQALPQVPQVAVFDTAFHQTLPPVAYTYAIDREVAHRYAIRRYGFHGTSHRYVSQAAAEFLGRPVSELNQIVLHLGNGASVTAVRGGISVETSMGMTPLEGLVMGTRSGDLDPAVLLHLIRTAGYSADEVDDLLNRRSGVFGLCGVADMRDVIDAMDDGDADAALALDVYDHRVRGYIGSYYAQLGHVDAVVFTGGVGENDERARAGILRGLEGLGIELDPLRNAGRKKQPTFVSADSSRIPVLVIPTNEELQIAREAAALVL